jgi:acyl dehydratase
MGESTAMTLPRLEDLHELTGREVAVTRWFLITQERIGLFAEATEDRQWIHLDRERAERESPYKSTIAHGFLTLSMLSHLSRNVLELEGVRMRVNYGLNHVRFPAAVKMGSFIRARFTLMGVRDFAEGADLTLGVIVELQGSEKPCCVAEWIVRYYRA